MSDVPESPEAAEDELTALQAEADQLRSTVASIEQRYGEINLRAAALRMYLAVAVKEKA